MDKGENIKKRVTPFFVTEWKEEEEYLREEHNNGWEFISVSPLGVYSFQRCKEEDVVYRLDYNKGSKSNKEEYIQIFKDCGWEYLQNHRGYSYFRKPASKIDGREDEIFSDDSSKLEMIRRVFIGIVIPLIMFFSWFIIQTIQLLSEDDDFFWVLFISSGVIALYVTIFCKFAKTYWSCYKSAHKK